MNLLKIDTKLVKQNTKYDNFCRKMCNTPESYKKYVTIKTTINNRIKNDDV